VETVSFYSYKGGVGRSLLLANAARYLVAQGKGVVALDFDFEAPGLHYKFGATPESGLGPPWTGGVVPYLNATADGANTPPLLSAHVIGLPISPDAPGWLRLMPAGPAPRPEYWAALKKFGERLRLGDPSGRGVMAFLDLQARIEEELKPDYLLIDARTGVTELGGLATTILADTVVCLFADNQESEEGTLAVVEALKAAPRLANQKEIRVLLVLSRIALDVPPHNRFFKAIGRLSGLREEVHVIFHSSKFADSESLAGSVPMHLHRAYLNIFEALFPSGTD